MSKRLFVGKQITGIEIKDKRVLLNLEGKIYDLAKHFELDDKYVPDIPEEFVIRINSGRYVGGYIHAVRVYGPDVRYPAKDGKVIVKKRTTISLPVCFEKDARESDLPMPITFKK